jgi:hypothetical protein
MKAHFGSTEDGGIYFTFDTDYMPSEVTKIAVEFE